MNANLTKTNNWKCQTCQRIFPYKETAELCCTNRGGCGKQFPPNSIICYECGDSIKDGKWFFCRECRLKKMASWRSAKIK